MDCILIGFNDEKMETTIKRTAPYERNGAAYSHMISRSAIVDGKRLKYSELVNESISRSLGMKSDLSIYRMPNMAVHYVMQYLINRGMEVEPINNYNFGKERLRELLLEERPLVVGVSSTCIVEAAPLREVVDYIKAITPEVLVVVGGPFINSINFEYATQQQDYLLKRIGADIFIHERQGEKTMYNLLCELKKEKPHLEKVPNILYKKNDRICRTEKIPENISLDEDPVKKLTFYDNHILPPVYVRTAISCSLNCAFCRYPILGGTPMYMGVKNLEMNLDYIHSLGVRFLVFIDDSLNIPLNRFKSILRLMIRKKYNFSWFSFFRISHSDEETYDLMEQSGCKGVILGIESGNNTILKNMDKRVTKEKFIWGINQLKSHNIVSYASCIIGFPGETLDTAKETINFIELTKPTFYDLQCWFYEKSVPISQETEYYQLTGYGYHWKHKDMDSNKAGEIVVDAIHSIVDSQFMPSLSFNLWSLAYYLSQGATVEEFLKFSSIFKDLIGKKKEDVDLLYKRKVSELMNVFSQNSKLKENLLMRNL